MQVIFEYINNISQGNPMIAGALTLTLSGMVMWMLKELPRLFLDFVKTQLITSLSFNNSGWDKERTFVAVSEFLSKLSTEHGSRTLILDSIWIGGKDHMVLTLGYGKHFFFYKGRLLWLNRTKLESSGSERQKEEITIYTFGRSHDVFKKLVEDNKPDEDDSFINFSEYKDGWQVKSKLKKHGLDNLALDEEVALLFKKEFDYFRNNEEDYRKLGLPYKMCIVLHGQPGSGKSSIIRSLASDYGMNVCNLPLTGFSDKGFNDAIVSAPDNSIIVVEDFDSCSAVLKRKGVSGDLTKDVLEGAAEKGDFSFLTLSGILNTLDGVASLDNKIIIFTTNCLSKIDSALLRSGRVDSIIELPKISGKTVKKHLEKLYMTKIKTEVPDMSAKDVNALLFKCKTDKIKMLDYLQEK